jgi:hypothetical protein
MGRRIQRIVGALGAYLLTPDYADKSAEERYAKERRRSWGKTLARRRAINAKLALLAAAWSAA